MYISIYQNINITKRCQAVVLYEKIRNSGKVCTISTGYV